MTQPEAIPSHMRIVPGSAPVPPAEFPTPASTPNPHVWKIVTETIAAFNRCLDRDDIPGLAALFLDDGFWRDHLVLSWRFRTVRGREKIQTFLEESRSTNGNLGLKGVSIDHHDARARRPQASFLDAFQKVPCIVFCFKLDTATADSEGAARLVEVSPGEWKIYTFFTTLLGLKGHEENILDRSPGGVEYGEAIGKSDWMQRRVGDAKDSTNEPYVLILGAGQAGLSVAARFRALGVDSLIIDKNERIGDNWRQRYDQLVLHDPVWYDHMPYFPFPPDWPVFTPKDQLADFLESYAKRFELSAWMGTTIESSKWDADKRRWSVLVKRVKDDNEETRVVHPHYIIQATGHSGEINMPEIKGIENFAGSRICHSAKFTDAEPAKGKKAVIVGSCNSAHDIAQAYLSKGWDVTMVQRSSTCVVSSSSTIDGLKGLYEKGGPAVEDADLLTHSVPLAPFKTTQAGVTCIQNEADADMLKGLEKAGFKVDKGPHGAGLMLKYFQRGGGYYIDVGASKQIAEGKIKIKQGQEVDEVLPHGLRFEDGSELEADEIVFATGYQNMRTQTRAIFGDDVADAMGDVWGLNEEGEFKGIWQQTGHPGFWFHGGNLALCRYYSRLLALQIKGLQANMYKYEDF